MEVKDIELKLNVKSFKAPKYIHLMALDAIHSFENSHPKSIPLLLSSLKIGDPKYSYNKIVELLSTIEEFKESLEQVKSLIEEHMYNDFLEPTSDSGHQYITPDGDIGISLMDGKQSVEINQGKEKPKKKPRKKRATKKKTTKKEE